MTRPQPRITAGYILVLTGSLLIAVAGGWTTLAERMDRDAYDWMSRAQPAATASTQSVVLAFDERTLAATGGMRQIRTSLARVLERVNAGGPAVVAIDIILHDAGDPAENARLAAGLQKTRSLVLASDLIPDSGVWENPLPAFRKSAEAVGHIHAAPDPISRVLPLELAGGRDRRWAMSLEAARLKLGAKITETPKELELGGIRIPGERNTARAMYVRYREDIPVISAADVLAEPGLASRFRDKVIFVGVTAQTAARDRLVTPLDRSMSGVEILAQAFETIMSGQFLRPAPLSLVVLVCIIFTMLSGLVFALLSGWPAYLAGASVILLAHITPHVVFSNGIILPYLAVVWSAWLSAVTAAAWQYFVVRRQLARSESDKQRYQEAIHFVTHEMRSPLTAIQGSSEMMGRYNLTEEKRRQMAQMINSESKRLAKMIQTFLDIERLTDGQTEIRRDTFELEDVLQSCVERARVLADRKQISLAVEKPEPFTLEGDRELMEYALYNLLTNAVKYSPGETLVTVSVRRDGADVRINVADQGMGMDEKELRNIGRKFYRTKKAEASGEAGTGIGLSLVQQIVTHHQGRMEVSSSPGVGSCFTMVLPAIPSRSAVTR
jgi:signal transduction histidine kinase